MKLQTPIFRVLAAVCLGLTSTLIAAPQLRLSSPEIRPETAIEIYFDQAVVPQNQVNKIHSNKILKILPRWKGKIKWLSTNSALFLPDHAPKMGTQYSFSLASGIKHLDGTAVPAKALKKVHSSHFKADYTRTTGSLQSNRTPATYIRFNDDISPSAVKKLFYYRNKEKKIIAANIRLASWQDLESSYYIKPNWNQRFKNMLILRAGGKIAKQEFQATDLFQNAIIVTPASPLPVGQDWKLHLKNSAPNSSKTKRTNTGFFFTLGNLAPFGLTSADASVYTDDARKIYISFNNPIKKDITPAELSQFISIAPAPANLKLAQSGSRTIVATGDFNQQNNFTINIRKGFPALNGLTQDQDEKNEVTFTHIKSSLGLPSYTLAQLSKGERIYGIDTVNMKDLHVRIKQLSTQQAIRAFLGYSASYTKSSVEQALPYALISGSTIYDKKITLDNRIDTSKNINFKWDDILPNNPENATLFISVVANPKDKLLKKQAKKVITQSIIQLTDIGLAWKLADDKLWVYAYSCETGKPLANVKLSTHGDDATLLQSNTTDKDGLCLLKRNQKLDELLVASLGSDTYIADLSGYIDTVSMWRFPIEFEWEQAPKWNRDLLVFTDRNLYKPSETVRIKGILREVLDNRLRLSKDKTISYTLTDPFRKTLSQGELQISDQGSFDLTLALPEETVGRYQLHFTSPTDDNKAPSETERDSDFYHSFYVAEFRRNAFEITSTLPQPKPAATSITLALLAKYYQGTPISEGSINWYFSATPTGFYPEKFRDFHFGDHREYDSYYWNHYFGYTDGSYYGRDTQHSNGKATLAEDGSISVAVDIPKLDFPTPQKLSFTSEVTDSRNQTLTNHSNTLVHPAHSYYGISRVDNLIRVGDQAQLNLVHIDLNENYIQQDSTATISIQREYNEAVLVQDKHGKQSTKNEKRLESLPDQQVTILAGRPTAFSFSPQKPGRHIITIKGNDTQGKPTISATNFYVYGKDVYPWATEDGIRIKMVAEKKSYKAGDTARILVMTPIEGTALVTVERLGVMRHYRRELRADKPVIEVPISAEDAPNAYISVLIIRGRADSKHIHKAPSLKLGFCKINVETTKQKLNIALKVEGQYHRPGEDITVSGTVTDSSGKPVANAEVVLYAEDEGILSVMGYSMPKPLKHFYRPRPLTLRTGVSLGYFITENAKDRYYGNKGFIVGGGGDDAFGSGGNMPQLKDKLRSNFDPCAFWMPTITTDANGAFTISAASPDTLTRYRIMALASSGAENFGSSKTSVVVSKDLMLEPATPRFANEGDHVNTKILVQNASKFSATWDITLLCDSLTMIDENSSRSLTKSISLSPGDSATLSYPVHFVNTGETTWKWTATPRSLSTGTLTPVLNRRLSDSIETKFKINYPRPLLRYAETIAFQNNNNRLFRKAPKRLLEGRGEAQLELSNSLLLNAGAAFEFLLKYPYGCVEQTSSSMMPWFAATDLRNHVPTFNNTSDAEIRKALQKGANRLLTMQTDSGGLAYWPGGEEAEDWATAYGGMALIMAKNHGANVPTDAISGVTDYLTKMVKNTAINKQNTWQNETLARSLYTLALAGKKQAALLNKFYQEKAHLSKNARIYLALAIHHSGADQQLAIELISSSDVPKDTPSWMRHRASNALQLLAWSTIAPQDPRTIASLKNLLSSRNKLGHWRTTWVNGWSLNAMATYARNVESQLGDITITLQRSGKEETIVLSKKNPSHSLQLTLDEAAALSISATGKVYASVKVAAKPILAPAGAESHHGVKITRRYQRIDAKGKASPLTNPRIGDLVKISLDITFPSEIRYVVIDDALPSTMETVNGDFATQSAHIADPSQRNWQISRRELRSDRALFFLNRSWRRGTQTISYLARITSSGTVHTPAAKVEAMYDPSVFGLTAAGTLTVEP